MERNIYSKEALAAMGWVCIFNEGSDYEWVKLDCFSILNRIYFHSGSSMMKSTAVYDVLGWEGSPHPSKNQMIEILAGLETSRVAARTPGSIMIITANSVTYGTAVYLGDKCFLHTPATGAKMVDTRVLLKSASVLDWRVPSSHVNGEQR